MLLERDPLLAALARDNVQRNELTGRVSVVETDLARATAALEAADVKSESFPVVLANPPYHDDRRSTLAESPLKAKVVEVIKKYNETMVKAGQPYRYG